MKAVDLGLRLKPKDIRVKSRQKIFLKTAEHLKAKVISRNPRQHIHF